MSTRAADLSYGQLNGPRVYSVADCACFCIEECENLLFGVAQPICRSFPEFLRFSLALPPLRPKRAAYGVAGLRSRSGQRDSNHALITQPSPRESTRKPIPLNIYVHILSLHFCPCIWGIRKREGSAPKASGCFLGGTGKAEDAKLPGAGIIPKPCPENERQKKAAV